MLRKLISWILICVLLISVCFSNVVIVEAKKGIASKDYIGIYYVKDGYKDVTEEHGAYNLFINKISGNKVNLFVEYSGRNGSPIYGTDEITSSIRNGKAKFKWKDSWENSGVGVIRFIKKHKIKLKMKKIKTADVNRATLDTGGNKVFFWYKN